MKNFGKLIELVKKCRQNCPWCQSQNIESYLKQVMSEAKELEFAIAEKNVKSIKEELGDLVWDTIMLLHIAEREGIEPSEVIDEVNKKIIRRKPYLESGEKVTIEQALKIWNEQKAREKE